MAEITRSVETQNLVHSGIRHGAGIAVSWNARKISFYLTVITFLLLGLHLLSYFIFFRYPQFGTASLLVQRLGLDRDGNIPTLFASLLLFFSAVLLFLISRQAKQQHSNTHRQWFLLCLVFVFLGVDEATQIHEFTSSVVKSLNHGPLTGLFRHAWLLPYLVLTLAVSAYFFRFVLALPTRTRNLFFLAGFLYVGSAMGLEMLEGVEATLNGKRSFLILQMQTVEEMLEMLAIILFNYALMQYLHGNLVHLKIEGGKLGHHGLAG